MDENTYRRSFVRKKPVLDPGKRNTIIVIAVIVMVAVMLLFNSFYDMPQLCSP